MAAASTMASTPAAITLDIISDVVCPWCFVGKRQLDKALAQFGQPVAIRWLPFFLNPDTPPEGEPYQPFLEKKFGSREAVEALWARVSQAGASAGANFAFEKIELRANTLAAHRLIHRFQQQAGNTAALVEHLFAAAFSEGRFIGDPAVLADVAAECGADRDATLAYLQSDEDTAEVLAQATHIRQQGIDGVPFFIFNGKLALSGAQPPEGLLEALRQASSA